MSRSWRRWVGLVALAAALAVQAAPSHDAGREILAGPVPADVVEVLDGDTIAVRARIWLGQELATHVRLSGIDAPELHGRCDHERRLAAAARDFLAERLADRAVELRDVQFGKYAGRVVARVVTEKGEDVAGALIAAGLARPYGGGTRRRWCE
ncbi:MAG: thermonuclease family protein [Candidatus Eiseniibacteriota bacterium]